MKLLLLSALVVASLSVQAENCGGKTNAKEIYNYFTQLAYTPIYENGKLSSYVLNELTEPQNKEAVYCLQKAFDLGFWQAGYTLHDFYKSSTKPLGIKQNIKKSQYYYNEYNKLKQQHENKPNIYMTAPVNSKKQP